MRERNIMKQSRLMRKLRVAAVSLAIISGVEAGAIGYAQAGPRPQTDRVAGTFQASPVRVTQQTCVGQDGVYMETVALAAGTSAGDPRLTGDLRVTAHILLNLATGLGTSEGQITVHDPATGRKKAESDFHSVITPRSLTTFASHGFFLGKVFDEGSGPNEELLGGGDIFGNFESEFDLNLNVTGQFGGTGDGQTPEVIQSGHCTGPSTTTP
jgi:hypothetical protein